MIEDNPKVDLQITLKNVNGSIANCQSLFLLLSEKDNHNFVLLDQTEGQSYADTITFKKVLCLEYNFTSTQILKFELYNKTDSGKPVFIADGYIKLGKIIGSPGQTCLLQLSQGNNPSNFIADMIIKCEDVARSREYITFQIHISKLKKKSGLWKRSPKLKFLRENNGNLELLCETEVINNVVEATFNPITISFQKLCDADSSNPFIIECHNYDAKKNSFKVIGYTQTTFEKLKTEKEIDLIQPKESKSCGKLRLESLNTFTRYHLYDYLKGGLELNLLVGIDFTSSNGQPNQPDSLHSIVNQGTLNPYQQALMNITDILLKYTQEKKIGAFGFGAKPAFPMITSSETSHCFPITGDPKNPYVSSQNELLGDYQKSLFQIQMSGPTVFAQVIGEINKIATVSVTENKNIYHILVILTDGELYDFNESAKKLKESSMLPVSVIFVGIGNEDFANVKDLSTNNISENPPFRDCANFVSTKDYSDTKLLTKALLSKIPTQIVDYMESYKIKPAQPKHVETKDLTYAVEEEIEALGNGEIVNVQNLQAQQVLDSDKVVVLPETPTQQITEDNQSQIEQKNIPDQIKLEEEVKSDPIEPVHTDSKEPEHTNEEKKPVEVDPQPENPVDKPEADNPKMKRLNTMKREEEEIHVSNEVTVNEFF